VFRRILDAVDRGLNAFLSVTVVAVVLSMVLLSFTQVLLRNITGGGISWADVVLRHLVLIVGMFGAVLAARQGRQISIDVLSRVVPVSARKPLGWVAGLFTVTITVLMTRISLIFVISEKDFGSEIAGGIAAWPFQLAIPAGFSLIGVQVLLNLILGRSASELAGVDSSVDEDQLPSATPADGAEDELADAVDSSDPKTVTEPEASDRDDNESVQNEDSSETEEPPNDDEDHPDRGMEEEEER
jgi:TRAP-type C4-dicarboxylate transport system permease small subunit